MEYIDKYLKHYHEDYVVLKGSVAANIHFVNCRLKDIPQVEDIDIDIFNVSGNKIQDREIPFEQIKKRWEKILPRNYRLKNDKYNNMLFEDIYNIGKPFNIFVDELDRLSLYDDEIEIINKTLYVESIDRLIKDINISMLNVKNQINYLVSERKKNVRKIGEYIVDEEIISENKLYDKYLKRLELLKKCKQIREEMELNKKMSSVNLN